MSSESSNLVVLCSLLPASIHPADFPLQAQLPEWCRNRKWDGQQKRVAGLGSKWTMEPRSKPELWYKHGATYECLVTTNLGRTHKEKRSCSFMPPLGDIKPEVRRRQCGARGGLRSGGHKSLLKGQPSIKWDGKVTGREHSEGRRPRYDLFYGAPLSGPI
ncbi:hypothetical protein EVAR_20001_1 [Eumeta japonica]|uniref:Uncharacterized protein n=1 Tax=Eumeta variegata TaxID=151549 RepID=A0A4C1V9K5_EUMVA|nr:hypothetical protein EVAR_20001_1 [Eumeta japonica]